QLRCDRGNPCRQPRCWKHPWGAWETATKGTETESPESNGPTAERPLRSRSRTVHRQDCALPLGEHGSRAKAETRIHRRDVRRASPTRRHPFFGPEGIRPNDDWELLPVHGDAEVQLRLSIQNPETLGPSPWIGE